MDIQSFVDRFHQNIAEALPPTHRIAVAVSGGLDSMVLLHLLKFRERAGDRLVVAHFDHAMRPGSAEDARWVAGICRSWNLDFVHASAATTLRSETAAREARYDFLLAVAGSHDARLITAHHADDQVETLLFRAFRGTGLAGLRGIPGASDRAVRPLLTFWRTELEEYADAVNLRWRSDETNETAGPDRNFIRHELLPVIERRFPDAKQNLLRLSAHAEDAEAYFAGVVDESLPDLLSEIDGDLVLDRSALRDIPLVVSSRILRRVLARLGVHQDAAGTRSLIEFITGAPSGRTHELPGGFVLKTEFESVRICQGGEPAVTDLRVLIDEATARTGGDYRCRLGGTEYRVEVGGSTARNDASSAKWGATLNMQSARFPLEIRARRTGDRAQLSGGSRSLKRLFIDSRIPRSQRSSRPVLVDRDQQVVWIAGLEPMVNDADGNLNLTMAIYDC